jgi:hypothetical protein
MLTVILFSIYNITVSAVIFFRYGQISAENQKLLILSEMAFYIFVIMLPIALFDFIRKLCNDDDYGEFK